ncbi:MAG: helix-turn-helix domain-containing protein [Propionicimonas sp.]
MRGWERVSVLSLTEVAAVLTDTLERPVSRSVVYEWAKAGRFPMHTDRLSRFRVRPADLAAFIDRERDAEPIGWDQPDLFGGA